MAFPMSSSARPKSGLNAREVETLAGLLAEWGADPVLFVREALGAEPDEWQAESLRALVTKRRVSVRSGNGVGKTTTEAWATLWVGSCLDDAKIGITAPAAPQIEAALWPEIKKWDQRFKARWPEIAGSIRITDSHIDFGNGNEAFARTPRPDRPEAIQGLHAKTILILVDEASGVLDATFEAMRGNLSTPGAMVLLAGNPLRLEGYFYESHHTHRENWHCMRVSSLDVPESRMDKVFIAEIENEYGAHSNMYRCRVLGEFPSEEDDAVIPLSLVEASIYREVRPVRSAVVWGVDVAWKGGDRSALAKRRGNVLLEPVKSWRGLNPMQLAGQVIQEWRATPASMRPHHICIDVIGIGAGTVTRLQEQGYPALGINVGELPAVKEQYHRLRDELWFSGREWFSTRAVTIPDDRALIAELTMAKMKPPTSTGKMWIESKEDTKKRTAGKSPDLADAFLLTFAVSDMIPEHDRDPEMPNWVD